MRCVSQPRAPSALTRVAHVRAPFLPPPLQVIGAGVGGMPYALKEAGFYSGILLICTVAMCSDYSLRLLVTLSRRTYSKYYEDLVSSQFGHSGYLFVVGAMGIFAYGAMVAYLMGIGAIRGHGVVLRVLCLSLPPPVTSLSRRQHGYRRRASIGRAPEVEPVVKARDACIPRHRRSAAFIPP